MIPFTLSLTVRMINLIKHVNNVHVICASIHSEGLKVCIICHHFHFKLKLSTSLVVIIQPGIVTDKTSNLFSLILWKVKSAVKEVVSRSFIPSIIETSYWTLSNISVPVCRLTRRADPRMCPGTSWGRARGSRGRLCPRTRRTSGLWTGPAPSPRRALAFRVFSLANRRLSYLLIGQRRERGTTSEMEKLVLTVIFGLIVV